jgi:hypothetical protein
MTSTSPLGTLGSVASLLAETFDKGNRDRNHKSLENVSTELQAFYILHTLYAGAVREYLHLHWSFFL